MQYSLSVTNFFIIMEFPELYRKVAFLPKRDLNVALQEFTRKKKWIENAVIIDIGCGDGSTAKEILQKHAPSCYRKIIGCDISENMIKYASKHFACAKMEFLIQDITEELPLHLKDAFDHAFSSYVLNRIKQQRAAFSHIYDLLRVGGNCLLLILGRYPVFDIFRNLALNESWIKDLKDVDEFTSPYHDSQDPKTEIYALMASIGFREIEVNVCDKTHTYSDVNTFKGLIKAINPFHTLNDRWDDFMADYFKLAPGPNALKIDYQLIVAYGLK